MSTDRQRAANRRNAQRSTGPRPTRGRAAVRSTHLQPGFYGRVAIPDFEDTAGYHAVLDDYLADLHPAGAVETELVHRLVMELWKLRRLEHLERTFLIASIDRAHRIIMAATGCDRYAATRLLIEADSVKVAIAMQLLSLPRSQAEERLAAAGGSLTRALHPDA